MKGKIEIVTAAVEDPNPVGSEKLRRQRVAVSAYTDALEMEYAYHRISTTAYKAGRDYQQVLEIARGRRSGGCAFEPRDRGLSISGHKWAIVTWIERAEDAVELILSTRAAVGARGELVLSGVLADGLTSTEMAEKIGRNGNRARAEIGRAFREGLEWLANYWGSGRR